MSQTPDDRSAFAKAYGLAMNIMTGCLMLGIPAALGYWLDVQVFDFRGFGPGTAVGLVLGFLIGGWHLLRILGPMVREALADPSAESLARVTRNSDQDREEDAWDDEPRDLQEDWGDDDKEP